MVNYRNPFGDGETVTNYTAIRTAGLESEMREMLVKQSIISAGEMVVRPVAPQSGSPLPLAISSGTELALDLLSEFPAEPEPAPRTDDDPDIEHSRTTEAKSGDASAADSLVTDGEQSGTAGDEPSVESRADDDEGSSSVIDEIMSDFDDL